MPNGSEAGAAREWPLYFEWSRFWESVRRARLGALGAAMMAGAIAAGCGDSEPPAPPVTNVVVAKVQTKDIPVYAEWVGSTEGYNNAAIRPQVKGYLRSRDYDQGTVVEEGQLLFQIDPSQFQAALDNALGQLGEARAMLGKSTSHVKRYRPLAADGAVSQQELEDAVQAMYGDQASVVSAKARVEQARLNLGWTRITAPIAGVSGIAIAQVGDLVSPETLLTTVSQLNPIKVQFPISEQEYMTLVKYNKEASSGRLGESGAVLQLYLSGNEEWPERGTPFVLGREVDPLTGTIVVEGRFPNPKNVLRPGQFAKVRAEIGVDKGALIIPQAAVNDVQGTYNVYVVKPDDTVEVRTVEIGQTTGTDWVIKKGLEKGETVIVEGFQRVRSGMKVNPQPQKKAAKPAAKTEKPAAASPSDPSSN